MIRSLIGIAAAIALIGCAAKPGRVVAADTPDPQLVPIAQSFARTVERIRSADDATWHTGWVGNVFVNALGGSNMGLCHEWRDAVFRGVVFDTRAQGWNCFGIAINRGTRHEHHAVLVACAELTAGDLLPAPPGRGAYVLDAWSRGRDDIYRLKDWIALPVFQQAPAELIDVGAELRERERARRTPGNR